MKPGISLLMVLISVTVFADDKHVLLVGAKPDHPFGTHMYAFDCQVLAKCLGQNEGVRAEFVATWPPEKEALKRANCVVFYSNPSGSVLLDPQHQDAFAALMTTDTGFVAIHWGTGVGYGKVSDSERQRDLFKGWLGGWFRRPPCGIRTDRCPMTTLIPEHPIARGWQDWRIHDEFYLDPILHKNATPFLAVDVQGAQNVVGWTFRRAGGGRSVGITLGHFHHNFARPDFRKLLVNAILWSARVDVPPEGANVDLKPGDVSLSE